MSFSVHYQRNKQKEQKSSVHIDLWTPSLSTKGETTAKLNMQSVVVNHA